MPSSTVIGPLEDRSITWHQNEHKSILIEPGIDFSKDTLSQFEVDNGKQVVFAMQQLVLNLAIGDKTALLSSTDAEGEDDTLTGNFCGKVP